MPTDSEEFKDKPEADLTAVKKKYVPVYEKIALGLGMNVGNWAVWMPKQMSNQVFNMHLHVNPTYIIFGFVLFRLIDAITDPITGWLSDKTRTRWGRRRPWMFVGGILLGVFSPVLWMVNPVWSEMQIVAWFLVIGGIHYLLTSIWDMPYNSLALEMTPDYAERTNVNAFRAVVSHIIGLGSGMLRNWMFLRIQLPEKLIH